MSFSSLEMTVSVIIPAYNAEQFISRTLVSVLNQTHQALDVIVVDDGSRDQTAEVVRSFVRQDSRVKLLQQTNAGPAAARNLAICHATGDFIAPIDADDIWHPENLEKQLRCFETAPAAVGVVYAWAADIDEHDTLTGRFRASRIEGDVHKTLVCHDFLGTGSASLIRRTALERLGGYDVDLPPGCEDWDLYLRLAEHCEFRVVPEFLVGYRKCSSSVSHNCSAMAQSHRVMLQTVRDKHPNLSNALHQISFSSFYLYLARQNMQLANSRRVLFWLMQAIKVNPLTLLRFGVYGLLFKSFLGEVSVSAKANSLTISTQPEFPFTVLNGAPFDQKTTGMSALDQTHLKVRLMVWVDSIFHRSVNTI